MRNIEGSSPSRPITCSRIPTGRGTRLKPGSVRVRIPPGVFNGHRQKRIFAECRTKTIIIRLRSRTGICAGLRTRAGLRSTAGSNPAGGTHAAVAQRWSICLEDRRPVQYRPAGSNPVCGVRETNAGVVQQEDAVSSNLISCGFKSRLPHPYKPM